jgi:hypothetical protein
MRTLFLTLCLVCWTGLTLPALAQQDATAGSGAQPKIQFEATKHKFGTVQQGEVVKHTFQFKNEGNAQLKLKRVKASCGCTVPSWPRDPIAPGETAAINVKFNTAGKMGRQRKSVTVFTNQKDQAVHVLTIAGEVTRKNAN